MKEYKKADHLNKKMHKQLGADYTPYSIAIQMAKKFNLKESDLEDWSTFKIFDPTVGMGNLFLAMKEEYLWLKNENFYGVDIDPEAIKFCIEKFPGGHFQLGDILEDPFVDDDFWKKPSLVKWDDYKLNLNFTKKFGKL